MDIEPIQFYHFLKADHKGWGNTYSPFFRGNIHESGVTFFKGAIAYVFLSLLVNLNFENVYWDNPYKTFKTGATLFATVQYFY